MKKIIFISSNEAKVKYLSDYFHMPVEYLKLDLPEIQSLSLREVAEDKAKRAYREIKKPVLVEDTSLVFNALGGLPGPLVKWFYEALGNEGLCRLLDDYEDKSITAEVAFAFCDEVGVKIFSGKVEGEISKEPRGEAGFGWDPIFIPKGYKKTWAEMSDNERHKTSMRKIALKKLKEYLIS